MEAKTREILDQLTRRLFKKPFDEITEEEREDLRARLNKLMTEDGEETLN